MTADRSIGTGAVGFGGEPSPTRTRPDWCAREGHPLCTYNPWHDRTWCLCGIESRLGDRATHAACCDGPLTERRLADGTWPSDAA